MKPRASPRARILALILSPLAALLIAESALRIAAVDPRPVAKFGTADEAAVYVPHPRYLWTLRPSTSLELVGKGFLGVRSNSRGLRGPEFIPPGSPDELRILCLGDSITFGLGLAAGDSWPERTEKALRIASRRPVAVVNAGVPGWTSVQGLRLYRDLLRETRFDFVVFWFGMNDSKPSNDGIPDRRYRFDEDPPTGAADLLSRLRVVRLIGGGLHALLGRTGERRVDVDEFARAVAELHSAGDRGGPRALFVSGPSRMDETIAEFRAMLREAHDAKVDVIAGPTDLLSPYGPTRSGRLPPCRRVETNLGPTLLFGESAEGTMHMDLADADAALGMIEDWKEALGRMTARLPADAIGAGELLGGPPTAGLVTDNCHLTTEGARRAGEAIAARILRLLR